MSGISSNVTADISATSTACTNNGTVRTCAFPITAPQGNATFTVTLYDGANGTGNLLGSGTATQAIGPGPFSVNVTVAGVVASIRISAGQTQFVQGTATTTTLTVTALDADNNTIAGTYATPITLSVSDTSGTFTVAPTTIASSTQGPVTLRYSGAATPAQAAVTASAPNVSAQNAVPLALTVGSGGGTVTCPIVSAGGTCTLPTAGSFSGTLSYPSSSTPPAPPGTTLTLTMSTTNVNNYPPPPAGAPQNVDLYLQAAINNTVGFNPSTTSGTVLNGFVPGRTYTISAILLVFGTPAPAGAPYTVTASSSGQLTFASPFNGATVPGGSAAILYVSH